MTQFLHDELKLELSADKTLLTHARTGAARFLGYEINVQDSRNRLTAGRRMVNGVVSLRVPTDVIKTKSAPYLQRGQPASRLGLVNEDDHAIVATYGAEYRGVVGYYLLAGNVYRLNRLHWVMQTSLLKTLAAKHRSTVSKMAAKYKAKIETPYGLRTCLEARVTRDGRKSLVARFGGIPLRRQKNSVLIDRVPGRIAYPHKELIARLQRGRCEMCEQSGQVEAHHVRKLADLAESGPYQPLWARLMAQKRRKILIICRDCHDTIHSGHLATRPTQPSASTASWPDSATPSPSPRSGRSSTPQALSQPRACGRQLLGHRR